MKALHLSLFAAGTLALASCGKDFLNVDPIGRELEINYYQNPGQAYEALVSVYDVLQWNDQTGFSVMYLLQTVASDDVHAGGSDASDQPAFVAYDNFSLTPNLGPQAGLWRKNYRGVYRANLFLEKIQNVPGTSDEFVRRTSAEAKFLRAYFYLDLLRLFGKVPLITNTLSPSEYYEVTMATPEAVFAQVEADLLAAIPDLPLSVGGSEKGRVTQGAAKALLARGYLYMNVKMDQVAQLSEEVIQSNVYSLTPNFADIFTRANEHGPESVFEIAYSENSTVGWEVFGSGYGEGNVGVQMCGMRDFDGPVYSPGWGFAPVSQELYDAMAGDPRRRYTIINADSLAGSSYSPGYQNTGYFMYKYAPRKDALSPDGEPALNWGTNVRVIRYADVLLMAAEGLARSGGSEATARGYLNQVRQRAGLQPIQASGSALIDAIATERRLELATEGHRFFDLVRTGKAAQVLGAKGFVANKHEWLPIPQTEIDAAQGALTQNPNY
jgi:hypothetical protein